MQLAGNIKVPFIFLRIINPISYPWALADRLGILGMHGQPHVGWGNLQHFIAHGHQIMGFLPDALVALLAVVATTCEFDIGLLLTVELFTCMATIGSGLLSLCFCSFDGCIVQYRIAA